MVKPLFKKFSFAALVTFLFFLLVHCSSSETTGKKPSESAQLDSEKESEISQPVPEAKSKIPVFLDTDANNELDDQHAMAYLFFNKDVFDVRGVTVNATYNGGDIDKQLDEAVRVMKLCNVFTSTPVVKGANGSFEEILPDVNDFTFDGQLGVDFMVAEALLKRDQKLVILAVGKLTNVALALAKQKYIAENIRIVWLGSNYPEPGEYNQDNDEAALEYILKMDVPFEMVTVRYGKPSGSDAVRATPVKIESELAGAGPMVSAVRGRHGGSFQYFGDYSIDLFKNAELHGEPPSRALFDMVAVAILKNPAWGESKIIPSPKLENKSWIEQPETERTIVIWENFDAESILDDFYGVLQDAK